MDYDAVADRISGFLADYLDDAGTDCYVIGVSGGLDSAVALHLAVDAVGPERVTGLVLPGAPSSEKHMQDARDLCRELGVDFHETSIEPEVETFRGGLPHDFETLTVGNLRARVRMVYLYLEANALDGLVIGPDNKSEYLLGYFTKYGDGAADVCPLGDLYKTEVYDLADEIGVDETFIEKTPTAELWEGQTDPGELGAPYAVIDPILKALYEEGESVAEAADRARVDVETAREFQQMVESTEHKRERPPTPGVSR